MSEFLQNEALSLLEKRKEQGILSERAAYNLGQILNRLGLESQGFDEPPEGEMDSGEQFALMVLSEGANGLSEEFFERLLELGAQIGVSRRGISSVLRSRQERSETFERRKDVAEANELRGVMAAYEDWFSRGIQPEGINIDNQGYARIPRAQGGDWILPDLDSYSRSRADSNWPVRELVQRDFYPMSNNLAQLGWKGLKIKKPAMQDGLNIIPGEVEPRSELSPAENGGFSVTGSTRAA